MHICPQKPAGSLTSLLPFLSPTTTSRARGRLFHSFARCHITKVCHQGVSVTAAPLRPCPGPSVTLGTSSFSLVTPCPLGSSAFSLVCLYQDVILWECVIVKTFHGPPLPVLLVPPQTGFTWLFNSFSRLLPEPSPLSPPVLPLQVPRSEHLTAGQSPRKHVCWAQESPLCLV